MVWDYRVVKKESANEIWFEIHEVYYRNDLAAFNTNRDTTICGMTENGCSPIGETPEELKADLERFFIALEKPTLNHDHPFVDSEFNASTLTADSDPR